MPYRLTAAATAHGHGTTIDGVGARPVLGSSRPRQNDALWTRVSLAMVGLFVNRTQWVVLSAINEHPWCGASHAGPGSARPAPTARFNLSPRLCLNYSYNEPTPIITRSGSNAHYYSSNCYSNALL